MRKRDIPVGEYLQAGAIKKILLFFILLLRENSNFNKIFSSKDIDSIFDNVSLLSDSDEFLAKLKKQNKKRKTYSEEYIEENYLDVFFSSPHPTNSAFSIEIAIISFYLLLCAAREIAKNGDVQKHIDPEIIKHVCDYVEDPYSMEFNGSIGLNVEIGQNAIYLPLCKEIIDLQISHAIKKHKIATDKVEC